MKTDSRFFAIFVQSLLRARNLITWEIRRHREFFRLWRAQILFAKLPRHGNPKAQRIFSIMESPDTVREIAFVHNFHFINESIVMSQTGNFTVLKAKKELEAVYAKLVDLRETGNPFAQTLVTKHEEVTRKNGGFKKCLEKIRGTNVISPAEINLYRFAPCTSVPVERLFSVLKNFIADRHNILPETLRKLILVKYNKDL